MLHGLPSPGGVGSELTHLLARLALQPDVPASPRRPVFAERLGHWLGWQGAISLSAALQALPTQPGPDAGPETPSDPSTADFLRVHAALEAAIAAGPREDALSPTDFGPYRRHCLQTQQAMQDAVASLRQRLRDALVRQSPAMARLAALDAVMDHTLAGQERVFLALVPVRLQAHFERLHRGAADNPGWLAIFRHEMGLLLRAERDHRLLPARGLLDTLLTLPSK